MICLMSVDDGLCAYYDGRLGLDDLWCDIWVVYGVCIFVIVVIIIKHGQE